MINSKLLKLTLPLTLLLGMATSAVMGQVNRYVVHFKDKAGTPYSISNPEAFLSARAIERRTNQGVAITEDDLPVNPEYVQAIEALGIPVVYQSRWFNAVLVQDAVETIAQLNDLAFVEEIEYVAPGDKLKTEPGRVGGHRPAWPTTSGRTLSTHNADSLQQNLMLDVHTMHGQGFTGEGMLIAVFDGGFLEFDAVDYFTPLLEENRILSTHNFVENEANVNRYSAHGTEVLSCIGAYDVADGLRGTGYGASFLLYISEDPSTEYRIEEYNWALAAERADSAGADIINSSLGYSTFDDVSMDYTYADMDGQTTVIAHASEMASARGIIVVTSAGNEGAGTWRYITSPGDAPNALTVGAVTQDSMLTGFSSIGPTADDRIKPDVVAMGQSTIVGGLDGGATFADGTSFSAPLMAGFVAGFWQANPTLTASEIIQFIKFSSSQYNTPDNKMGYGLPNFSQAQHWVVTGIEAPEGERLTIFPNPVNGNVVSFQIPAAMSGQEMAIAIHDLTGKLHAQESLVPRNAQFSYNIEGLPPGTYVISMVSGRKRFTAKLIKK